jgi:DNA topoisomerase VI subunit B
MYTDLLVTEMQLGETISAEMTLPCNPLDYVKESFDQEARRRSVEGILESYHSNYDVLAEAIQNAVDAVEDASLAGLAAPYLIEVTINLAGNWISVLDTGLGMSEEQVAYAFAPQATYKDQASRPKKNMYRGYKGVGLTFLAYGQMILRSTRRKTVAS